VQLGNSIVYFKDSVNMKEIKSATVALVVTSPPYYNYIEYGNLGIGTENKYEDYLENLRKVFAECYRVLIPDGKFCINITNMKSRKAVEGVSFLYSIIADVTKMMQTLGFLFFDEIVWIKGNANNGALNGKPLFGSYPYPPTPKILDSIFENILIFKKEGKQIERVSVENRELSRLTKQEWILYTKGIWQFEHDRSDHPASFPEELPKRLIRMYSFVGEMVLDPFAGTGTTLAVADKYLRKSIGYEIFKDYEKEIHKRFQKNGIQELKFPEEIESE
jgi:DNA modification methylase